MRTALLPGPNGALLPLLLFPSAFIDPEPAWDPRRLSGLDHALAASATPTAERSSYRDTAGASHGVSLRARTCQLMPTAATISPR